MERLYHVVCINDSKKREVQLTGYPMNHAKCMTFISKQTQHKETRYMVKELTTYDAMQDVNRSLWMSEAEDGSYVLGTGDLEIAKGMPKAYAQAVYEMLIKDKR